MILRIKLEKAVLELIQNLTSKLQFNVFQLWEKWFPAVCGNVFTIVFVIVIGLF